MAAEEAGGGAGAGEGFESRVKRLFGSQLFDDVPGSSFPAASWSVASGEVERHRWARPSEARDEGEGEGTDRGDTPCASAFYDANGCLRGRRRRRKQDFEGDLGGLGDDEEEEEEEEEEENRGGGGKQQQQEDEEEGVRVSIGLDPTLDREEEEDKYDREALGREDVADRVYMNEIMGDGINMSINTVVPDILDDSIEEINCFSRDPREDLIAASSRLRECDVSAKGGPCSPAQTKESPTGGIQVMKTDDFNVKPILKRKEEQGDSKPKKRVKFAADVKDQQAELPEQDEDSTMVPQSMDVVTENNSSTPSESPGVPDYVKNPSNYRRYTLDTTECNDESNRTALADLHNMLRRSEPEAPVEIPTSVMFISPKKSVDAMTVDKGPKSSGSNSSLIGLVAAHCTFRNQLTVPGKLYDPDHLHSNSQQSDY
ncbi:hypothetical protein GUJ93_ZPchr0014g46734 [Zizania palustris]|uniref:U5 small nuclear ribonucleoprotein TSSC4 n=1 Tax=Zizania palustris TaxID=103762 RepID=A0A8J5W5L0_ZIZPA|nr:hypothetical protein GUJ93_ZPchr0014g46734 [Zizania palustris]